jgi:hypothetical protein
MGYLNIKNIKTDEKKSRNAIEKKRKRKDKGKWKLKE